MVYFLTIIICSLEINFRSIVLSVKVPFYCVHFRISLFKLSYNINYIPNYNIYTNFDYISGYNHIP